MGESGKRVQRVRIGLTGLAFVFVLVLLGAIFASPSAEEPITTNLIEAGRTGANSSAQSAANDAQPAEPLAEIGVAPGNGDDNASAATPPR
jgi:hypothetical protein